MKQSYYGCFFLFPCLQKHFDNSITDKDAGLILALTISTSIAMTVVNEQIEIPQFARDRTDKFLYA